VWAGDAAAAVLAAGDPAVGDDVLQAVMSTTKIAAALSLLSTSTPLSQKSGNGLTIGHSRSSSALWHHDGPPSEPGLDPFIPDDVYKLILAALALPAA
jgi:hypothetical protein